jgi:hypothetical protein
MASINSIYGLPWLGKSFITKQLYSYISFTFKNDFVSWSSLSLPLLPCHWNRDGNNLKNNQNLAMTKRTTVPNQAFMSLNAFLGESKT